jgi:hypothetical protein
VAGIGGATGRSLEEAIRPATPTLTQRGFELPRVALKQRTAEAAPSPLNSTVPGLVMAMPARTVDHTRNGGSVATAWLRATQPLIQTGEVAVLQLAWSLLGHNTTGMPRLIASLRASCNADIKSLDAAARRLFSIIDWKLGTPMPNNIASIDIVTINSMRVNPL